MRPSTRSGRALSALSLATALVAAGCGDGGADGPAAPPGPEPTATTVGTTTTASPTTTTTAPPATTTTVPPTTTTVRPTTTTVPPPTTSAPPTTTTTPPAPATLRPGASGPEVRALQQQLTELRYWVGPADGTYGTLTEQAVYAFQKVNGLAVDGVAGREVRGALTAPAPFAPQATDGFEVDKARQVLFFVRGGTVEWAWNTSTGTEEPYTHDGRELLADTPPGSYEVSWQVDGWRDGDLGRMWRPKYFHPDGIAVHGYESVPPVPASHGCVRVTIAAMDAIWASGLAPVGTPVLVHGTSPT